MTEMLLFTILLLKVFIEDHVQMKLELKQDKYENFMFWIEDNASSGIDVDK